jgi:hypothetical protein
MSGRQLHRVATFVLSLAMAVIGVALVVQGLDGGSAVKALLGVLFVAAGAARSYLEVRRGQSR